MSERDEKRDELLIDLMAGGIDPVTSFVVAESETPENDREAPESETPEPKSQSDSDHAAGCAVLCGIVAVIYAAFQWLG